MHIRPATIADSADLAVLDDIVGRGLPLYPWQGAVARGEADSPLQWGRALHADQSQPSNGTNAAIAEVDGRTAGASVGCFMPPDVTFPSSDEPVMPSLMRIFARAAGSWVVDMLAVFGLFTGRSITRALLCEQVKRAGAYTIGLVAADDNAPARAPYRSEGVAEIARDPFVPFRNDQKTAHGLLHQRSSGRQGKRR